MCIAYFYAVVLIKSKYHNTNMEIFRRLDGNDLPYLCRISVLLYNCIT